MLVRISCKGCRIRSLWTDDPESFLVATCVRPSRCQARLLDDDGFGSHFLPTTRPCVPPEVARGTNHEPAYPAPRSHSRSTVLR